MRYLFLCSALCLAACGVNDASVLDSAQVSAVDQELSANGCKYRCQKCPPSRVCTMECKAIGNCQACTTLALCVAGYHWDEAACACLPDAPGAGESCGSVTCPSGQVCCNASCGICTQPGDACIQIACQ